VSPRPGLVTRSMTRLIRRFPAAQQRLLFVLSEGMPDHPIISQSLYPLDSRPRYGEGRPPHPALAELIGRRREAYAECLRAFLELRDPLIALPLQPSGPDSPEPAWTEGYIPGLDMVALYGFLARYRPRRYVEIGSGKSTKIARRAIRDQGLPTRIQSIDPQPRAGIDALCDEVVRQPLESIAPASFDCLEPDDILFFDGSHRCLMNSDVTVVFLEVLPRLRPGVIVHIHDVFLPYDYPEAWRRRYYSEQYLLAAWLLAGTALEILLPAFYIHKDERLDQVLAPLWNDPRLAGVRREQIRFLDWLRGGTSFWLRIREARS
jgi:hypothetical protein